MYTEGNGKIIKNEDRKNFKREKMLKFSQFCNFQRALGKINVAAWVFGA